MSENPFAGCDCSFDARTRRAFLKTGLAGLAATAAPSLVRAEASKPKSETLVETFYHSLTEEQRGAMVFPFDHELRSKVDNNWFITPARVAQFGKDQQEMIRQIFLGLHSPEYAEAVMKQVEHDAGKDGFGSASVALFGQPGTGKFEFVLTGRHCTRRCDGDSVEGAAFGGPIFYGHAPKADYEAPGHPDNVYWFQAKRANELFQMLDGKQRDQALIDDEGREEKATETVKLAGKEKSLLGLPVSSMSPDQREHMGKVIADLLAPFRKEDADEALKILHADEKLHLSFYKKQDIGSDGVWDVWQVEGPSMVWFFRGDPHVHVWANIRHA